MTSGSPVPLVPSTEVVDPRTKGLLVEGNTPVADLLARRPRFTGDGFSWPLLTLDDAALDHNIALMARLCADREVEHAPHVKTTMSRALFARQLAAGAWGATVATPVQLRTVRSWGAERIFLANELVDPREIAWLRREAERAGGGGAPPFEAWLYVDSRRGVDLLARGFAGAAPDAVARVGVLVEFGVADGRTGVRTPEAALDLARAVRAGGFRLLGVAGYEGSVAGGASEAELAAVGAWCDDLRDVAGRFVRAGLAGVDEPVVVSAGGSSFLDVVLARLPGPLRVAGPGGADVRVVVRSGAYVTHDHGFYARMDPWARIPGAEPLRAAATVWGQVLSVPEPGLVICGVGRRDVSFDIDLPVALRVRPLTGEDGVDGLGAPWTPLDARVTALNDQHLYLRLDPEEDREIGPGDVVGFGISHPCTTLDRWRIAAVVGPDDEVTDLVTTDF